MAKNLIGTYWRSRRHERLVTDDRLIEMVELAFSENEDDADADHERRRVLARCVEKLNGDARTIISLTYEQDLPAAEVAQRVGRTYQAVLMALSRARRALETCVQRGWQAETS